MLFLAASIAHGESSFPAVQRLAPCRAHGIAGISDPKYKIANKITPRAFTLKYPGFCPA